MNTQLYIISEEGITVLAEKILRKHEQSKMIEMKQKNEEETFIDIIKVAELLQLSKQTVYGLVNRKKIPFHKRGKKLYFLKNQIIEWVTTGNDKNKSASDKVDEFLSKKANKKLNKL